MNCRHIKLYLVYIYMHSFFYYLLVRSGNHVINFQFIFCICILTVCSQVSAPSEFLSLRNAVKASFLILICLLF